MENVGDNRFAVSKPLTSDSNDNVNFLAHNYADIILKKLRKFSNLLFVRFKRLKPKRLIGVIMLCVVFFIITLTVDKIYQQKIEYDKFCRITVNNLCNGEYTEVTGYINNPQYKENGYEFILEANLGITPVPTGGGIGEGSGTPYPSNDQQTTDNSGIIRNPIYIADLIYSVKHISLDNQEKDISHKFPFGSLIKIRGRVKIDDKRLCAQESYAKRNSNYCKPDGFRIVIEPNLVETVPQNSSENIKFSIFGDLTAKVDSSMNCIDDFVFCERDNTNGCYKVKPETFTCKNIRKEMDTAIIQGDRKQNTGRLEYASIFLLKGIRPRGVSYTDPDVIVTNDRTYKNSRYFNIYDQHGELLTRVKTNNQYLSSDRFQPANNGVYFLVETTLYYQDYEDDIPVKLGTVSDEFFTKREPPLGMSISNDGKYLVFETLDMITQERNEDYLPVNIYDVSILRINLEELDYDNGGEIITPEVLYKKRHRETVVLLKYSFSNNKALVFRHSITDQHEPCYPVYDYGLLDIESGEIKDVLLSIEKSKVNCTEPQRKPLYISDDLSKIIFSLDHNPNTEGVREQIIEIYSADDQEIVQSTYLASEEFLKDSVAITNYDQDYLDVIMPESDNVIYKFDLNSDRFVFSNLIPYNSNPLPTPKTTDKYLTGFNRYGYRYLIHDDKSIYFLVERNNTLIVFDRQTMEFAQIERFASNAETFVVNGDVYVIQ